MNRPTSVTRTTTPAGDTIEVREYGSGSSCVIPGSASSMPVSTSTTTTVVETTPGMGMAPMTAPGVGVQSGIGGMAGPGLGTVMGAGTTTPIMNNLLPNQADRFIEEIARLPKELAYYEQCIVRYNEGMRFTPEQGRRFVEVLIKNARGSRFVAATPYYSAYALELLLKLAMVDTIIRYELQRLSLDDWKAMRLHRYIRRDETKPLGYNFILFLSRVIPTWNTHQVIVTKKGKSDQQLRAEIDDYLGRYSSCKELPIFLDSTMHRLPQINSPYYGFAGGMTPLQPQAPSLVLPLGTGTAY